MRPSHIEYKVGQTVHNQPVRLVWEEGCWSIYRDEANQREALRKAGR